MPECRRGMAYIDGFVIAVPTANKQTFIDHAAMADPLFIEMGATQVVEAWQDDGGGLQGSPPGPGNQPHAL